MKNIAFYFHQFVRHRVWVVCWALLELHGDNGYSVNLDLINKESAQIDLQLEEKKTKEAMQLVIRQLSKASQLSDLRVLIAEKEALSFKLKWIGIQNSHARVIQGWVISKKDKLETSTDTDIELSPERIHHVQLADRREKAERAFHEALLLKMQFEVDLAYHQWQIQELKMDEAQSLVVLDVRKKNSQKDVHEEEKLKNTRSEIGKKEQHLIEIESLFKEASKDSEKIYLEFQEAEELFDASEAEQKQRSPHIHWIGASQFAISAGVLFWPTYHRTVERFPLQPIIGSLGVDWTELCRYQGHFLCRLGVDFITGGDLLQSSFLIGGGARAEAGYPISDRFFIGGGIHAGYLAVLGGKDLVSRSFDISKHHGLFGVHALVRSKISAMTELSVSFGGSGVFGTETGGSLFIGLRFTVRLPMLSIKNHSSLPLENMKDLPPTLDGKKEALVKETKVE